MSPNKYPWNTDSLLRERATYEEYEAACDMAVREDESLLEVSMGFDQTCFSNE